MSDVSDDIEKMAARIEQLEYALRPFAHIAKGFEKERGKHVVIRPKIYGDAFSASDFELNAEVTVEDLRHADNVLNRRI